MRRKDDRGHWWTDRTRLHTDLGWDEWYVLRVARPVRTTVHVALEDRALLALKTVGDLVKSVWDRMATA
jgi:hypothetical protein